MFEMRALPKKKGIIFFILILLLNVNFALLRSVRNTLAIADIGGSAASIPFFELFGTLPAAYCLTTAIAYLLRSYTLRRIFLLSTFIFIIFFLFFASFCHPLLCSWHQRAVAMSAVWQLRLIRFFVLIFYVLAELWKPILIQVLFFGCLNAAITIDIARKVYPLLMLGSSLGAVLAGPIIAVCISSSWGHSFILLMIVVFITGIGISLLSYLSLTPTAPHPGQEGQISLNEAIKISLHSPFLKWLLIMVFADYIVYSLGEVIFLEILKERFSEPNHYCRYMGKLSTWSSLLTLFLSLFAAPVILKKFTWTISALVLPCVLLILEGSFFLCFRIEKFSSSLFRWTHQEWLYVVIWLGSLQFTLCRAIKYTFFDVTKEIAFIYLPNREQINGKLVIDGLSARLGRGGAAALNLGFIHICGGVLASSWIAGTTALAITCGWVFAVQKLGKNILNIVKKRGSC